MTSLATFAALSSPAFAQTPPTLPPAALPTGGSITAGAGSLAQSGADMNVTQHSERMVAEWNSFNIGANASVNFAQPSAQAIALNRVLGADPSNIQGRLSANGRVFLLNPNGVIFGSNSRVDVGGIVASSQSLSNEDFLNGNFRFSNATGAVSNQGTIIAAPAGYVILSGTSASNAGTIDAAEGTAALVAGESMTLEVGSTGLLSVSVAAATLGALAQNSGVIRADGGVVFMLAESASAVPGMVISAGGTIQAQSITERDGKIYLDGGARGEVRVTGTLDASAENTGVHGGDVTVLGEKIALLSTAHIDAAGDAGGGTVLIGGNWQGKGAEHNAAAVVMDRAATINTDAKAHGDGGTVVLWSEDYTNFQGAISARGGAQSGNGGQIETSSTNNLQAAGNVDASGANGVAGMWLLDPQDVSIENSTANGSFNGADPNVFTPIGPATVDPIEIRDALDLGTSVTITTGSTGSAAGNITVNAPIEKLLSGGEATLTLAAAGSIIVNSSIMGYGSDLNVVLNSNTALQGGYVQVGADIFTNGGDITIGGGANPLMSPAVGTVGQHTGVIVTADLAAAGGAISILGRGDAIGGGSGVHIDGQVGTSGAGNVTITGDAVGNLNTPTFGVSIDRIVVVENGQATVIGTNSTTTAAGSQVGVAIGDSIFATGTGGVTVQGTGGGSGGSGGSNNYGINQTAAVTSTSGAITIHGTGGGSGSFAGGYYNGGYGVNTVGGNISITGLASLTAASGDGVFFNGGTTSTGATGAGTITITGTGRGSDIAAGVVILDTIVSATNGPITITGTSYSSSADSGNHGVSIGGTTAMVRSTGTGSITLTGSGGGSGFNNYGVSVGNPNGIFVTGASGNSPITLIGTGGGTGGTGGLNYGVASAVAIAGNGGDIAITGVGGASSGGANTGVEINGLSNTGAGKITVHGTGGSAGAATGGGANYGISLINTLATATGAISLTGIGGNTIGDANYGVINDGGVVSSSGGTITIAATSGGSGLNEHGFFQSSGNITTIGADISVSGTASATASNGTGASFGGGTISTTGAGKITIIGTGNGAGSFPSRGVSIAVATIVSASNGLITVTGTSNSSSTAAANYGIQVIGTSSVRSTGSGGVKLTGFGGGSGAGGTNHGVLVTATNGVAATVPGANAPITIDGTAGNANTSGASNMGVSYTTALTGNGGDIRITGTGGVSPGNSNTGVSAAAAISNTGTGGIYLTGTGAGSGASAGSYGVAATTLTTVGGPISLLGVGGGGSGINNQGVRTNGAVTASAAGAITLNGTAGGTGTVAHGVVIGAGITSQGGNITVIGSAPVNGVGTGSGVNLSSAIGTNGSGAITVTGTANGTGALSASGVALATFGGVIRTVNGALSVTGSNSSTTATANQTGVSVGNGASIVSDGTGSITVSGTGGGTGSTNYGVYLAGADGIQVTSASGNSSIAVTGVGGGAGGSGASNTGVLLGGALTGKGGNIYIEGYGGAASGDANFGISSLGAIVNTGAGNITLYGTGGGVGLSNGNAGLNVAAVTTAAGAINFDGVAGRDGTSGNRGITLGGNVTATGAGNIIAVGAGAGSGVDNHGVYSSASITSAGGAVSVTGRGPSGAGGTGTGSGSGVYFTGAATAIQTNGAGSMLVVGTTRGSASEATYGVYLGDTTFGISATNGALSVSGQQTATSANHAQVGVFVGAAAQIGSSGTGAVAVTGVGNAGGGTGNHGIVNTGTISAVSGALTINGTGRTAGAFGVLNDAGSIRSTGASAITINATRSDVGTVALYSSGLIGGASASGNVVINANDVTFVTAGVQTSGNITIAPRTAATTVGIGTSAGAGSLSIVDAELNLLDWGAAKTLSIGGSNAGAMTIATAVTFAKPVSFSNVANDITVTGTLASTAAGNAIVLASGRNFFGGTVSVSGGGRWLIYSVAAPRNNETELGSPLRVYAKTTGSYAPLAVTESGNVMLYSAFGTGTITITAQDESRLYGAPDSVPAYVYVCSTSCTAGDALATLPSLSTIVVSTSDVGTYPITVTGAATNDLYAGYLITHVNGTQSVTPAPLNVTATGQSKVYGAVDPALGYTYAGLTNGDTVSIVTGALARDAGEGVGTHEITQGTLSFGDNYLLGYTGDALTIAPRNLTVTTDSATQTQGGVTPEFTGANDLTLADAPLISWIYGPVAFTGAVGSYVIDALAADPSNLLANYIRTNNYGALTVTAAAIDPIDPIDPTVPIDPAPPIPPPWITLAEIFRPTTSTAIGGRASGGMWGHVAGSTGEAGSGYKIGFIPALWEMDEVLDFSNVLNTTQNPAIQLQR